MKQVFSLIGKIFLVVAFLTAGAEVAAHSLTTDLGWMPSMGDVWKAFAADHYAAFFNTNPALVWVIMFNTPGWVFFGLPGLALVISCGERDPHEDAELEESMYLFDELAKRVKEETENPFGHHLSDQDDMIPDNHASIDIADNSYAQSDIADNLRPDRDYLLQDK